MRNRILLAAGALVVVAVPAVVGLWGNASFAQSVPVRVPASGQVVTPTPSPTVDDHGGATPRDQRTEPGDDRDVNGSGTSGTSGSGSGSSGSGTSGSGSSGHGGDDAAGDDHGGSGHGGHGGDD